VYDNVGGAQGVIGFTGYDRWRNLAAGGVGARHGEMGRRERVQGKMWGFFPFDYAQGQNDTSELGAALRMAIFFSLP
jgi:hypothetical protein